MKITKSQFKKIIREELVNEYDRMSKGYEYDRGLTPNDLLKELNKQNKVIVKILNKYENSIKFYMPKVIQKWMMSLHKDIKKEGYRI